jgi:hypothetical protein
MAARLKDGESYYYETTGNRVGPVFALPYGGFGLSAEGPPLWGKNGIGLRRTTPEGKYITQDDLVEHWEPPTIEGRKDDPVALTGERKKQHGDWSQQAGVANALKLDVRRFGNWADLTAGQQEAIDMILTKVSRVVSGDPTHADHWDDIAGYAYLGKGGHAEKVDDYVTNVRDKDGNPMTIGQLRP